MLLGAASMLAACGLFYPTKNYRYRLTIDGVHSGSAVYEVLSEKNRFRLLADETAGGSLLTGEALVIETPTGPIFVLLKPVDENRTLLSEVTHALAPDIPKGGHDNFWKAVSRLGGRSKAYEAELPRASWPLIVRFGNIAESASVEVVDPDEPGIRRMVVQTTQDPVTVGLKQRLAWLETGGLPLDRTGGPCFDIEPPLAKILKQRDFSTIIPW